MTESHDDRTPVEHDPTGMRALLSSLPDPGPMPDHLVARITAALAAEADAAAGPAVDAPPASRPVDDDAPAPVVPLPRRPGVRMRHLGVAAAVVGALGLTGVVLSTTDGGGLTAAITGSRDSAESAQDAQSGAGADSGGSAGPEAPAMSPVVPPAGSGQVVVVMSGRDYVGSSLSDGVAQLVAGQDEQLRSLAAEAPGIGPIGTPLGARDCAAALGIPSDAGLLVDVADVDGRPAAVLVVDAGAGRQAYAVERSCTTGTAGPISGPVAVD